MGKGKVKMAAMVHCMFGLSSHMQLAALNPLSNFIRVFIVNSSEANYNFTPNEVELSWIWSLTSVTYLIGCAIGSFSFGYIADKMGRRNTLMVLSNAFCIVGCLTQFLAVKFNRIDALILGRLLVGCAGGICLLLSVYLAECASDKNAAFYGSLILGTPQFLVASGTLFNLPFLLGKWHLWSYSFLLPVLPATVHLMFSFYLCRSPKHLYITLGEGRLAEEAFRFYRGRLADWEGQRMEYEAEKHLRVAKSNNASVKQIFTAPHLRWPLILCVVASCGAAFGGVDIANLYSSEMLAVVGVDEDQSTLFTVLALQFPSAALGAFVVLFRAMDRFGRRPLLLLGIGCGIVATFCLFLAGFHSFQHTSLSTVFGGLGLILAQFSIYMGPDFVIGVLPSDLAPQASRAFTGGLSWAAHWNTNLALTLCYHPLSSVIGSYAVLSLTLLGILSFAFLYTKLPESKGRSVEDIANIWRENEEDTGGRGGERRSDITLAPDLDSTCSSCSNILDIESPVAGEGRY